MKKNINYIIMVALSLSVLLNVILFVKIPNDGLNIAAKKLSKFGDELGNVSKANPITQQQKKQIVKLAGLPVPISKAVAKHAVITSGVGNSTLQPIVMRSDTGEEIQPCLRDSCKVHIVDPTEELTTAINATKPIKGKIIINGKEKPATFVIGVKALYEGSYCETYFFNGSEYWFCWDIPNF